MTNELKRPSNWARFFFFEKLTWLRAIVDQFCRQFGKEGIFCSILSLFECNKSLDKGFWAFRTTWECYFYKLKLVFWCNYHLSILIKWSPLEVGPKDVAQDGWTSLSICNCLMLHFVLFSTLKFLQINLSLCTFTFSIHFLKGHKLACNLVNKTFIFIFGSVCYQSMVFVKVWHNLQGFWMITRSRLRRGEGALEEPNPQVGSRR